MHLRASFSNASHDCAQIAAGLDRPLGLERLRNPSLAMSAITAETSDARDVAALPLRVLGAPMTKLTLRAAASLLPLLALAAAPPPRASRR